MTQLREIMTKEVQTVTEQDNIFSVALKMKEYDVGMVPVVRGDHCVGVITDRDIVIRGIASRKPNSAPCTEVMTTDVISGTPDMDIEEAAKIMAEHQIRRMPVVENGTLVGIVALKDFADHRSTSPMANMAFQEISETEAEHQREMKQ